MTVAASDRKTAPHGRKSSLEILKVDSDLECQDLKDDLLWRGSERGGYLPRVRGVGNIGKPPISVPKDLLIALKVNSWATELEVQSAKWRQERTYLAKDVVEDWRILFLFSRFTKRRTMRAAFLSIKHGLEN